MSPEPRRVSARAARSRVVALLLFVMLTASPAGAVRAQSFSPMTVAQLIAAITTANSNNADNTITLVAGATFTLAAANNGAPGDESGLPRITTSHTLTINGNGATIERSGVPSTPAFRIFAVDNGASLTLTGLTVRNGSIVGGAGGPSVSGSPGVGGAIFVA